LALHRFSFFRFRYNKQVSWGNIFAPAKSVNFVGISVADSYFRSSNSSSCYVAEPQNAEG
jgi:hypothetical protein